MFRIMACFPDHRNHKYILVFLLIIMAIQTTYAQEDTTTVNRQRLTGLLIGGSVAYGASVYGLYHLWYKDYDRSTFHWFNDNKEWMGVDKLGHVTTSYWLGTYGYNALRWAGVREKDATWYGGLVGLFYLTTVEVFDGFSAEWGASPGDIIANIAGAGLFIGQQIGWKEQRLLLKFSYHPTEYAEYRPDVLGNNPIESLVKDYNGQTYWLSGNISSFMRRDSNFPPWINISIGYGAKGMLGGESNPPEHNGVPLPQFKRLPQFYLSLDADLTRIKTRSKVLKGIFTLLGFVKIPFPAIEFNAENRFKFHILYF